MKFEKHDVEWVPDKIGRFWDFISNNKSTRNQFFGLRSGDHVASVINKTIRFKNLKNILDLSCGSGDVLSSCLKYLTTGQNAYGTEFSEKNVTFVNERFKGNSFFKGAHLLQKYPSPFDDGHFDLVIITEVVEHLADEDLSSILNESRRLLSPGGYICITTPNAEDLDASKVMCPDCGCVFHRWQHVRSWTPDSLEKKLQEYAFSKKMIKPVAWSAPLKKRVMLKLAVKMNFITPYGLVYIGIKQQD